MTGSVAAIVLTGGRGSRLGGRHKAAVTVAGRPLGETVHEAAAAVAGTVVTVGPGGTVREEPPYSGPVAGIAAGLAALGGFGEPGSGDGEVVVLLACDLPDLDAGTLRRLVAALAAAPAGTAAAVGVDTAGRDQVLLAAWDRRVLADRLRTLGDPAGRPVRSLYRDVPLTRVDVGHRAGDVDTWADLARRGPVALAHVGPVLRAGLEPLPAAARAPLAAIGGVLAAPLVAADPMPRGRVSAMDGYALAGPGPWTLLDHARRAGDDTPLRLSSGDGVPIATGALAPEGTDRVLRHELVAVTDGLVEALPAAVGVDDLRAVGEDWSAGHELAPAGTTIDAALASAAVSAGLPSVEARGPVRAAVVTTGDEVLPADTPDPLPPGRIRDTVGPVLGAVLQRAGFAAGDGPAHRPDTADALDALLAGDGPGAGADALVLVGATGRGVADHLRAALGRAGARIVLDGVRVRPGGSQLVAVLPDGRVLLGLPGNPLAAVCAAATTGRVVVDALTGRSRTPVLARADGVGALAAPARARLLPARPDGAGGWLLADRVRTAHLADLAGAPALAAVPERAVDGDPVELLEWI